LLTVFRPSKRIADGTRSIYRNQAREDAPVKKQFINDTIRNDFHRKFLHKYVQ